MSFGFSPAPMPPLFSAAEFERAYAAWGCNCGPGALAAICGLTLEEARGLLPGFDAKRYTNPTMMLDALRAIAGARAGFRFSMTKGLRIGDWPRWGLMRVQWEGPWTDDGVPIRARYRYTHWIGASRRASDGSIGVFDVNCLDNGSGWAALEDWRTVLVPFLTGLYPRASGGWHVTHSIEVDR